MPRLSDVQAGRIGEGNDLFARFRTQTKDVGPRLLEIIDSLPLGTKPLRGARLLVRRA